MYRLDVNQCNHPSYYWNPEYTLLKAWLFAFGSISSSTGLNPGSCMTPHTNLWDHDSESDKIHLYRPFWVRNSFQELWCFSEIPPFKRNRSLITSCSIYLYMHLFLISQNWKKAVVWGCNCMGFFSLFLSVPCSLPTPLSFTSIPPQKLGNWNICSRSLCR